MIIRIIYKLGIKIFQSRRILILGLILFSGVFTIYCQSDKKEAIVDSEIKDTVILEEQGAVPVDDLKFKILWKGDTLAYLKLRDAFLLGPEENILFWSLIMANKYDYYIAYFDVFFTLKDSYQIRAYSSLDRMDKKTRVFALKYLKVAAERGHSDAQDYFKKYCEEGIYVTKEGEIIDEDEFP